MKTITMDFEIFERELEAARYIGFKRGIGVSRRITLELLAGATTENMSISDKEFFDDTNDVSALEKDLRPRIERIRK